MEFELRHFDTPLLRFSVDAQSVESEYEITWVNETERHKLPHGLELSSKGIYSWIKRRIIPKNRAFASTFLARNGLSSNRPLAIIALCKGLSLNDCYWVVEKGSSETFDEANLYDNRMSRPLAQIALTGYGNKVKTSFLSSPEFTTNGMLPKCWRRISGEVLLYKGGTSGFANAGFEPYSEYYAADLAQALGINHIDYELHTWKGILCSSCKLFTSKDVSFVPAASVVKVGGFQAIREYCSALGEAYEQSLSDMLAFDAIICNTDRHLNNFGFLADSHSNEIIALAPLFDHGNTLFYQAFGDDWSSADALSAYAEAQSACLYDDFFTMARSCMTQKTRSKVRKALDFSFSRKPVKGFSKRRLLLIQEMIRQRARKLLE